MRIHARPALGLVALGTLLLALGCGDTAAPTVSLSVSPDRFPSGRTTRAEVVVTDFELAVEEGAHTHTLARGAAHADDEEHGSHDITRTGHYHIYLDSLETNPIKMASETSVDLTITASAGAHRLIVRLHGLDHKIIEPQITDEAMITIE